MGAAAEEQKRHKGSRQQDPRKGGKEGAIRRSGEWIWSEKSYFPAMVYPKHRKPTLSSGLEYTQVG